MAWFSTWWQGLTLLGQVFACAAIPMTVIMFLQFILMIIGYGGEADGDTDSDINDPIGENPANEAANWGSSSILKIFTVRGIVAFFALGGWAGLAALTAGIHPLLSIWIALFAGVSALLLASIAIRLALRMQSSGNLSLENAISHTAEVYIRIPAARSEKGKVSMLLQERFVELEAVTDSDTDLMPQSKVEVIALAEKDCLLVRPVTEEKEN